MGRVQAREVLYATAERFADACLLKGESLFTPGKPLWHTDALDDVWARTAENLDESKASFYDKLHRQLDGAPADRYQLTAETLAIHHLVATDLTPATKRDALQRVLSWSPDPVAVPELVDEAMEQGLAATGVAFKTYKPFQFWMVLRLARAFAERPYEERQTLLDDPWAFKELLFSLPVRTAYSQREALLHLVHPDTFEPIVSRDHKSAIDAAFHEYLDPDVEDIDRRLLTIRHALAEEVSHDDPEAFTFYMPEVFERWYKPKQQTVEEPEVSDQRAWLLRGVFDGESAVQRWIADGYAAVGWDSLGQLPDDITRDQLLRRLEEHYPDAPRGRLRNFAGNLDRFLNQMHVGDLVVVPDGADVYVGVVTSEPYWATGSDAPRGRQRRSMEWANGAEPLERGELSPSAYSKMRTLLTITEITELLGEFATAVGLDVEAAAPAEPAKRASLTEVRLPRVTQELARDLLIDEGWLHEVVDLLGHKRQFVLYGPPGTGKTFLAQRLARHLTDGGGTYQLVQFHPSYAYEDFFEGFRPRQTGGESGTLQFELVPGPLRSLADVAREDPTNPYVLVIDELNRANLAKVFGELYFLLEYRDEEVTLQYASEESEGFQLPRNLFLIGTMNTADRSIALVDAAMRRRFMSVGLFPDKPPIDGLLRRWLTEHGLPETPAKLLEELNRRLDDRNTAIGPSYLMDQSVADADGLERIWRYEIMPLLEEQFIGSGRDVDAEFGLEALRRAVAEPREPTVR